MALVDTVGGHDTFAPLRDVDTTRWVIMPVAIPGCGGGPALFALEYLFGFIHVHRVSENECTDARDQFRSLMLDALEAHDIVIADCNNSRMQDRLEVSSLCASLRPRPKILALNWDLTSVPASAVHALCLSRLPPLPDPSPSVWQYIDAYAPLLSWEADATVNLDISDDISVTVARLVAGICVFLQVPPPAESRILQLLPELLALVERGESIQIQPIVVEPIVLSRYDDPVDRADTPSDADVHVSPELAALVRRMIEISTEPNSVITPRCFNLAGGVVLTCWEIQKSAFYEPPPWPLPTSACGLWTRCTTAKNNQENDESDVSQAIVARGYDKFYDINEAPWTTWKSLGIYMVPPFHVTAKVPGRQIMISSLSSNRLLVTSKYPLGTEEWGQTPHSGLGQQWLSRHLDSAGKSPSELARRLWLANWTLMCQLLDDDIEEHVVGLSQERRGLHLHGINHRTMSFRTETPSTVAAFAAEWGLLQVSHKSFEGIPEVESFIKICTRSDGSWNGDGNVLQGLVVRTTVHKQIETIASESAAMSPYPPPTAGGVTFLFKVPFNKDYELWQRFRELTLAALDVDDPTTFLNTNIPSPPRFEMFAYQVYLSERLLSDDIQIHTLRRGRGLIQLREGFFAWLETPRGKEEIDVAEDRAAAARHAAKPPGLPQYGARFKSLVMLVGLPGCGKTFISRGLALLFGFKHVEWDAFRADSIKMTRKRFLKAVRASHTLHDVVIADARCHRVDRRDKLCRNSTLPAPVAPKVIALDWQVSETSVSLVRRICSTRLHRRDPDVDKFTCDRLVRKFYGEHEPLSDTEVTSIICMQYDESMHASLTRAANAFSFLLGIRPPPLTAISDAVKAIAIGPSPAPAIFQAASPIEHFAFIPEIDVNTVLRRAFSDAERNLAIPRDSLSAAGQLVYSRPQVTIAHPRMCYPDAHARESLLQRCSDLPTTTLFLLTFTDVFFNDRIIGAKVQVLAAARDDDETAARFIAQLPDMVATQLHLVLARQSKSVSPTEASRLLQAGQSLKPEVHRVNLGRPIEVLARVEGFGGR